MRAGARFTVSPFNWPSRMVRFVVMGGALLCCCAWFCFLYWTNLIDSWIFQISSIGCKDCHYRNDACSNRPKKMLFTLLLYCCFQYPTIMKRPSLTLFAADRRATARTTETLSHAAFRSFYLLVSRRSP